MLFKYININIKNYLFVIYCYIFFLLWLLYNYCKIQHYNKILKVYLWSKQNNIFNIKKGLFIINILFYSFILIKIFFTYILYIIYICFLILCVKINLKEIYKLYINLIIIYYNFLIEIMLLYIWKKKIVNFNNFIIKQYILYNIFFIWYYIYGLFILLYEFILEICIWLIKYLHFSIMYKLKIYQIQIIYIMQYIMIIIKYYYHYIIFSFLYKLKFWKRINKYKILFFLKHRSSKWKRIIISNYKYNKYMFKKKANDPYYIFGRLLYILYYGDPEVLFTYKINKIFYLFFFILKFLKSYPYYIMCKYSNKKAFYAIPSHINYRVSWFSNITLPKIKKIIIIILEEIRNQIINLLFILIIDFFFILFERNYYPFLFHFTFIQYNYITLTISLIIYLALLPWLIPIQVDLMIKYNKRSRSLKKKDDNENNSN